MFYLVIRLRDSQEMFRSVSENDCYREIERLRLRYPNDNFVVCNY